MTTAGTSAARQSPGVPGVRPVVRVEHLRKTYGATVAADDVSFTVGEGEIFGMIGPTGAG